MGQHLVWDWNGTLFADTALSASSANVACSRLGASPISLEEWRRVTTRPSRLTYESILARRPNDEEWHQIQIDFLAAYEARVASVGLAKGARDALATARDAGWTQSVLSLHPLDLFRPRLEALGIGEFFIALDGAEPSGEVGGKKEMFAAHLARLALSPQDVVLIGDMADDAVSARALGAQVILVTCGDTEASRLTGFGAPLAGTLPEAVAMAIGQDRPVT